MSDVPPRLLRETLRRAMTPGSTTSCLDTATLAAWSDGALSARERATVESHAADCARCQALLVAMARTMPPAPQRSWWRSSAFNWLVPIAVAATALVVWINVDTSRSERFAVTQRAPAATAAAVPPESAPAGAAPTTAADRLASTEAKRESDQSSPAAAVAPRRAPPAAGERRDAEASRARQFDKAARTEADLAPKELRETVPVSPRADSPPAVAAPAQSPPPPVEAPRADASSQAAAGAAPQANVAAPPAAAPVLRAPARAMLDASASSARGQAFARTAAVPLEIVSPNPNVRWRIVTAGSVDRSVDGGTTWQTQSTGVPALLTAGAAPSPAICWLVGSGGTIVLSTDGRTWQRVAFPEEIHLISIRASDAANATVTTADGRTFATSDGGKTWRPAGIRQ